MGSRTLYKPKHKHKPLSGGRMPIDNEDATAFARQAQLANMQRERMEWLNAAALAVEEIQEAWTATAAPTPYDVLHALRMVIPMLSQPARITHYERIRETYEALEPRFTAMSPVEAALLFGALADAAVGARGTIRSDISDREVTLSSWLRMTAARLWQVTTTNAPDFAQLMRRVLAVPVVQHAISAAQHRCPLLDEQGQLDATAFTPATAATTTDLLECLLETIEAAEDA